jgi:predicted O-methyltransferase YrrM
MTTDAADATNDVATPTVDPLEALMGDIYTHVRENGAAIFEGGASPGEAMSLRELAASVGAVRIAEIGFNVGFSALAFLESSPQASVVSFELNERRAVLFAKGFVDERYPGRHELVIGDSLETLPRYADAHPRTFDLVFVDGGHSKEIADSDIRHACRLARPRGLVVVDDVIPWFRWGAGPHAAWNEAVAAGLLDPVELRLDGRLVSEIVAPGDRAWAVGRTPG